MTITTSQKVKFPREDWQEDTWEYFDAVGEFKHSVRYVGNGMGKLRLYPAVANPIAGQPPIPITDPASGIPTTAHQAFHDELNRLKSERGGQAEILRTMAQNLEVAAECYIVGRAATTREVDVSGVKVSQPVPESWDVRSISEVKEQAGITQVLDEDDETGLPKWVPLRDGDTVIRIWQRHPRFASKPDCAAAGMLTVLEAMHTLALAIIGEINSKRNNGFVLVPNELSFTQDQTANDSDEGDEQSDDDKFMEALTATVQGPIADPASPSASQPTLIRGPAEFLEKFRHVALAKTSDNTDDRIEKLVGRLARGLDLPVEVVMGHMGTTFANAAQIDEDTFDDYMAPRANLLVDGINYGYYVPNCLANPATKAWADQVFVWYDASELITQPDPSKNASEAHARMAISDSAYRRYKGLDDEDAPDADEILRRTGVTKGILTADLTLALLKLLGGSDIPITQPAEIPTDPQGDPQPVDSNGDPIESAAAHLARWLGGAPPSRLRALTASATGRANPGAKLLAIDIDMRTRLTVATDAAMSRALEKAGNRLRGQAKRLGAAGRNISTSVATLDVAPTLGRALVASLDVDPLDGAWDELETQFRQWASNAQNDALDVAQQIASGFTSAERSALGVRQATNVDEAWTWMRAALDKLANDRMFDPTPSGADLGEFDATSSIPTGLIRQAMSRAGGATGLVTNGADAWVAVYPDGTPPGMIGTGEDVYGVLGASGVSIEGYRWVYGPASRSRPFEPHADLDGIEFVNFDDAVLANSSGWPDDAFYFPGDHSGCLCDFEPTLIAADE